MSGCRSATSWMSTARRRGVEKLLRVGAGGDQALAFEQGEGAPQQLGLRGGDHAGGDFFKADLKQKVHGFLS